MVSHLSYMSMELYISAFFFFWGGDAIEGEKQFFLFFYFFLIFFEYVGIIHMYMNKRAPLGDSQKQGSANVWSGLVWFGFFLG